MMCEKIEDLYIMYYFLFETMPCVYHIHLFYNHNSDYGFYKFFSFNLVISQNYIDVRKEIDC